MSLVHKVIQLWRPGQYIKAYDAGPRLQHLFGAGEQGGVYLFDKAHQGGLFQDAAFTTPVTAVEQYVGSFLDWSGNGNHCAQPTSTARGKWSARVNLLTKSEDFANAAWVKARSSASANVIDAPDGSLTGDALIEDTTATSTHLIYQQVSMSGVFSGTASVYGKAYGRTKVRAFFMAPLNINNRVSALFDLSNGTVPEIDAAGTYSNASANIVSVGGWHRCSLSGVKGTDGSAEFRLQSNNGTSDAYTGDGTSGIHIWGADLRPSAQSYLPYQRVNTATDYDTAGFPHYLLPDGADDYYTSASGGGSTTGIFICTAIAPWNADAKQVIWSDASGNTGYELCINASNQVEFSAGTGSARVSCVSAALTLGAPKVITAQHDGTTLTVRVDGVATTAACGAASAGTAGTTLLRANGAASSYAKVQVNGFLQRHGAQPSAQELAFTERYMATLQGRTL